MHLLLSILLLMPFVHVAADGVIDLEPGFDAASRAYAAENYTQAVEVLENVLEAQPDCADCAHLLGKAYGRLAEQASWFRAAGLARKTLAALEQAVALDSLNDQALEDLIKFYRRAPGFLGGDDDKADELERLLQELRAAHTS